MTYEYGSTEPFVLKHDLEAHECVFNFVQIGITSMRVYMHRNCKVATIDQIERALLYGNEATKLELINRIKEISNVHYRKLVFNCQVCEKESVDILKKHFTILLENKLPIGYGEGDQYFCTFLFDIKKDYNNIKHKIDKYLEQKTNT